MSLHDVLPILLRARSAGEDLGGIGVTDALKVPAAPAPGRRLGWRGTPVARFAAEFGASPVAVAALTVTIVRSEEHTSELQSLMRISYAVFCLKKIKQRSIS